MKSQQYTTSFSGSPSYLHSNFHYLGQAKGKFGKGYNKNGKPKGVQSGPCQTEGCPGTIITIKMNTSRLGMECSSEKVCDTCGRVYPQSFPVLSKPMDLTTTSKGWETHKEWIQSMKDSETSPKIEDEGTAIHTELYEHNTGHRPGFDQELETSSTSFKSIDAKKKTSYKKQLGIQLGLNNINIETWTGSNKAELRNHEYKNYVSICRSQYGFTKNSADDINYLIDNFGLKHFYKRGIPYQEIIYYMFMYLNNDTNVSSQKRLKTIGSRINEAIGL